LLLALVCACGEKTPPTAVVPPTPDEPVILVGAGNIASCGSLADDATATLIDGIPGTVFALGDNAYVDGSAASYNQCYHPTWGRFVDRTKAVMGNHDYDTGNADAAFDYFGTRAGPRGLGYHSFDIGAWHIIVLNDAGQYFAENPFMNWNTGSPQEVWLKADLAANTKKCIAAMFHVPMFLSSNTAGYIREPEKKNLWDILYAAKADIVLNGQQHHYERMAPMNPEGARDDALGIREFIVGTGGGHGVILPTVSIQPNSQVLAAAIGVLKLTLYKDHYTWQFVPVPGESFTDSGTQACHASTN
jgi:hypothetical protein